ncbi:MAG: GTP 3',8-cyclase MoaA [Planctomycetota bacterium]|nr:GTP 3',8-cyclase MoaA [Planctomycetota bacterium]
MHGYDPGVESVTDTLGRPLRDLRISVTDRCNFRCAYCMPKEAFPKDFAFMQREKLLKFGEITSIVKAAVPMGLRKVRLTGGEPLLRKEIEWLIKGLRAIEGVEDIALTTNGSLLAKKAPLLADAGLDRVTVSLDSLDDATFRAMNDVNFAVERVLAGIEAALAAGLTPVKINMVVKRGVNDDHVVAMAKHFRGKPVILRFIEFMDVGTTNGWRLEDVVPAGEILKRVTAEVDLEPLQANYKGETALRYGYADGVGEIGFIASVTQPFCSACNRARLSADGHLYTCLFGTQGHDLRRLIREEDASVEQLTEALEGIWRMRADRYSEIRSDDTRDLPKVEMSYIGG